MAYWLHQENEPLLAEWKHLDILVISGFRHEVDENCALVGYYAASSGNFLPTFRDNVRSHLLDP
jgi:hypothetical protein